MKVLKGKKEMTVEDLLMIINKFRSTDVIRFATSNLNDKRERYSVLDNDVNMIFDWDYDSNEDDMMDHKTITIITEHK